MEKELGIGNFVKNSYKIYGREANINRHIPYLYDGLKPSSQRLIFAALSFKGLMKTATVIGECTGKFHPHGIQSLSGTVTSLVNNLGVFKGKGNFGYHFLTGETCEEANPRYTEVMLKSEIRDQLTKFINFVPKIQSEIGYDMPRYIPTPIPLAFVSGDIGIAIGINQKIPAFTAKSIIEAYRADDPMKLESQYGLELVKDSEQLKNLWTKGSGRLHVKMKTVRDNDGITIEGDPTIFTPDLGYLFQEFKYGNVDYQDLSAETCKLRFSKAYRVRKITTEEIQQVVEKASHHYESYYIRMNDGEVAQPISMRTWIDVCYKNYSELAKKGNEVEIKKTEDKIKFYSNLIPVSEKLRNAKMSKPNIASELNLPIEIVNKVASKSLDYIRECNVNKEIDACNAKLKELKNGSVEKAIDSYVEALR